MDAKTICTLGLRVLKREAAEALYLTTRNNLTRPSDIRATLTERCNYRCQYCDHWRQNQYTEEMSLVEWQGALVSLSDYIGHFTVQFIGGEPTIWPGFMPLVEFVHDNHMGWGVITNGSTLTKLAAKLVKAHPTNIDVSLDGLDPAINDWSRGVPGCLNKIMNGVNALVAARAEHGRYFPIRIKPVIVRQTIDQMVPIVRWAATIPGIYVDFNPVRLWRKPDIAALYPASSEELRQLDQVIEELILLQASGAPIETSPEKLRAILVHFQGNPIVHAHKECRVGLRSMDIRPNGDVNHCWRFNTIGNLRRQSARQIWESCDRQQLIPDMLHCAHATGLCGTACTSHRNLLQDVKRGLALFRDA